MNKLANKVAIITGASSGIGCAVAQLFSQQGAAVVVAARREPDLLALVANITDGGGQAVALAGDVQDEQYAQELVHLAVRHFGRLDVAVNNAGTLGPMLPSHEVCMSEWNTTIATNLSSAFVGAKYQIPEMLKHGTGSVIFTSTFVGHTVGMPQMAAYAASKAGLLGLTKTLAVEYGSRGIRVNALLPGGTDTPMGRTVAATPEAVDFVVGLHALKRMATPAEIAKSALYLASDDSSFVTGTSHLVDGGISILRG